MSDSKDSIEKDVTINEEIIIDKEGKERVVESNSTVIKEDSNVTGVMGIVRDIAHRKQA